MLREIAPGTAPFEAFIAALKQASLPTDDLLSEPFHYFQFDDAAWGGIGVTEDALLRSIVVTPSAQGRGLGAAITQVLAEQARRDGVKNLWLLTTDAAPFFARLGWRVALRDEAPPSIVASRQFSELCPASATLMVRAL